jgi:hypothetical protein
VDSFIKFLNETLLPTNKKFLELAFKEKASTLDELKKD